MTVSSCTFFRVLLISFRAVPKAVGARHYMKPKRKVILFYPRYAAY